MARFFIKNSGKLQKHLENGCILWYNNLGCKMACLIIRLLQLNCLHAEVFRLTGECSESVSLGVKPTEPFDTVTAYFANSIRRGIEAVITGLTRNQFVDNTTRGFESLPLRQKYNPHPLRWGLYFFHRTGFQNPRLRKRSDAE